MCDLKLTVNSAIKQPYDMLIHVLCFVDQCRLHAKETWNDFHTMVVNYRTIICTAHYSCGNQQPLIHTENIL